MPFLEGKKTLQRIIYWNRKKGTWKTPQFKTYIHIVKTILLILAGIIILGLMFNFEHAIKVALAIFVLYVLYKLIDN